MLCLAGAAALAARAQTFNNPNPVIVPTGGSATTYPSSIPVVGINGPVARVTVTLHDVVHPFPDDLDVLLVGPGGQSVLLMSDAGGNNPLGAVDLTFTPDATVSLPDANPIGTGIYRPTNHPPGETFPGPAPNSPYGGDLGVFSGTSPLGNWHLFVMDDSTVNGGGELLGGWQITFESALPPIITQHPGDQTVAPGGTASFSVMVTGTPPFGYQWLRNGEVVVPFAGGGPTLTIENVQAENAGTYSVIVTNSASPGGVASDEATLSVTGPLTLVEPPQDQMVAPGSKVVFRVTAAGTPPLNYLWRLNGALLPEQTGPTLTLDNVQARDGGAFSVTVWNDEGVLTTTPGLLVVNAATHPPPADDFSGRPRLQGRTGILQGDSSRADSERDEPVLPGGGRSVWSEWTAPVSGIVTLTARGSAFDSLLAVFTGEELAELTPVTSDDDQGGFFTSTIRFNARGGSTYQWMLDGLGFGGSGGPFTLAWSLEPTDQQVPVIVAGPEPQGVKQGTDATFRVVTASLLDRFQWYFNGEAIAGATGRQLVVSNVQSPAVGFYSVQVTGEDGLVTTSPVAPLQMGSFALAQAEDKVHYINNRPTQGVPISVGLGETDWNEFPALAGGGPGDPNPCDEPFFETLFQLVQAEDDGVIRIDTDQSEVFLLLGVYEGAVSFLTNANLLVACDVISGPDGLPCAVQFPATMGSNYTAVVAPLSVAGNDNIRVTATMGAAPPIPGEPQCLFVPHQANQVLNVPEHAWTPPPVVQWRFNGQDIPGATNASLGVSGFDASLAGTYSVVLSNFVSSVTNTVAHLAQSGPPVLLSELILEEGVPGAVIRGSADQPFALEAAIDLTGPWLPVATNAEPCFPLWYTNLNVLLDSRRMFRAVPWIPPGP